MLAYFATLCGLGISVPLDKGLPFDELESSLQRSKADVLVFDSAHLDLVRELQARGSTQVADFISMGELEGFDDINHLMREGRAAREQGRDDYLRLPVDGQSHVHPCSSPPEPHLRPRPCSCLSTTSPPTSTLC